MRVDGVGGMSVWWVYDEQTQIQLDDDVERWALRHGGHDHHALPNHPHTGGNIATQAVGHGVATEQAMAARHAGERGWRRAPSACENKISNVAFEIGGSNSLRGREGKGGQQRGRAAERKGCGVAEVWRGLRGLCLG